MVDLVFSEQLLPDKQQTNKSLHNDETIIIIIRIRA